jgi:hypothetical protein
MIPEPRSVEEALAKVEAACGDTSNAIVPSTMTETQFEGLRALDFLRSELTRLRDCLEEYADLDGWDSVRSPETTSAWQKRWGHPTPWVDAQKALARPDRQEEGDG